MSAVWITSDLHFDHTKVAQIRGFDTKEEHDESLIKTWNSMVDKSDQVWVLGDVGMGSLKRFSDSLRQLKGTKHLIAGNHDECSSIHRNSHRKLREWLEHFESIQQFARRKVNGQQVLLSHYPYTGDHGEDRFTQYRLRDEGLWLLHGHTHSNERISGRQIHVGLDAWSLRLVNLDEIAKLVGEG